MHYMYSEFILGVTRLVTGGLVRSWVAQIGGAWVVGAWLVARATGVRGHAGVAPARRVGHRSGGAAVLPERMAMETLSPGERRGDLIWVDVHVPTFGLDGWVATPYLAIVPKYRPRR